MKSCNSKFKTVFFLAMLFFGLFGLAKSSEAVYPVAGQRKFLLTGFLFTFFIFFAGLIFASPAYGAEYYVSPTDSLATAVSQLQPGDTLILRDGTYYQSLNITVSGTAGNPITIKAEHDGLAIVDGQNAREPFRIEGTGGSHKTDITVEGIVFKNSNDSVVIVHYADRINLKRVSGYNALVDGNTHIFDLWYVTSTLLEDCVASGTGRVMINVLDSDMVKIRRCYTRWTQYTGAYGMGWGVQIYGTPNSIVENCVAIKTVSGNAGGIAIWSHTYSAPSDDNKIYGNVVILNDDYVGYWIGSAIKNITGNQFVNNVVINTATGFQQRADDGLLISNLTSVSVSGNHFEMSEDTSDEQDLDFKINTNLKNSSFLTTGTGIVKGTSNHTDSFLHTYNNLYNLNANYSGTTQGTGEIFVNPVYDISTYGNGAYLTVPTALVGQGESGGDIGAKVLYRYVDGVLTGTALWPWPMEQRICNETGYSVTYENSCANGGGIWKTLDGVYADTTPPAAPQGLTVN
ncbi:MAG: chondroitinase-B domain-containing protein [Candidatus Gottesmanbacteria bacterium]